ncbi:MAG: energy-coupling factor transporter transmembrane protein EcfT [Candidatus Aenigmarchaeota archaeon]|nr:energy-coupling factor transporter transmembrane protein EcfT [Candidatus Aenigmarchaeota archaeon]MCK4531574.1 energy-coupling factor transporter transmembrane protein EcfT [Candidatus Aenigmarchaeota archaeon]
MLKYSEGESFFHKLDPRTKLFFFISLSVLSLLSTSIIYLSSVFAFTLIVFLANRLSFQKIKSFSKFFIILSIFVVILQGFFYPLGKTILSPIPITLEGLAFGFAISLRLFTILLSLSVLMLTTKQKYLLEALGNFIPKDFALSLTTAFRFIPIIEEEARTIIISQEARGLKRRGKMKLTAYFPIIVPLFAKALTRAKNLAISVESRGFGRKRTKYDLKMKPKDWLVVAGTLAFGLCLLFFHPV